MESGPAYGSEVTRSFRYPKALHAILTRVLVSFGPHLRTLIQDFVLFRSAVLDCSN